MANVNELATTSIMENAPPKGIPNDGTGKLNDPRLFSILTNLGVIQLDPWLEPFRDSLKHRFSKAQQWIKTIDDTEGGIEKFSRVCQAPIDPLATANHTRVPRSLDLMSIRRTTLHIGNGLRVRHKHS